MDRITSCKIIKFCQTPLLLLLNTGNDMKQKIISTLIECILAIIIFGGIGVMLAWRGWAMKTTPTCPDGLYQFDCEIEGVNLVCFMEYFPEEIGSVDSYGSPYEPNIDECMSLNNAYIAGNDVDIGHLLLQEFVDHIEVSALDKFHDR